MQETDNQLTSSPNKRALYGSDDQELRRKEVASPGDGRPLSKAADLLIGGLNLKAETTVQAATL